MLSGKLYKKLEDYQQETVREVYRKKEVALFFEQGTGKTWISGGIIEQKLHQNFQGLVIGILNNLNSTWKVFLNNQLPGIGVYTKLPQYLKAPTPKVMLINWESLSSRNHLLIKQKWDLIIADESQKAKDRTSQQSRALSKLGILGAQKIILSGTPIEKYPIDLWAQFKFLAPQVLGKTWKEFDERFLFPVEKPKLRRTHPDYPKAFLRYLIEKKNRKFNFKKLSIFLRLIKPYCFRVEAKDVLDLPSLEYKPVLLNLSGREKLYHDRIKRTGVLYLSNGKRVIARTGAIRKMKCHQICGGTLKDENERIYRIGDTKLKKTVELVRAHRKPIVIFCRYVAEIFVLQNYLKDVVLRVELFYGGIPKKHREELKVEFQSGKIDVLIVQNRVGGTGVDLYKASVGILYSMDYSSIDYSQMITRLYRRGQTRPVTIFLLIVRGTIDEKPYKSILEKQQISQRVLSPLKRSTK